MHRRFSRHQSHVYFSTDFTTIYVPSNHSNGDVFGENVTSSQLKIADGVTDPLFAQKRDLIVFRGVFGPYFGRTVIKIGQKRDKLTGDVGLGEGSGSRTKHTKFY